MVWCPLLTPTLVPQHSLSTPFVVHPLTPHPSLCSESKLGSIRKEILKHVQGESWSRSQQLMKELTDFIEAFQIINSDIHTIARCSQKVGPPPPPPSVLPSLPGPSCSNAQQDSAELPAGPRLLDCAHMGDLPLLPPCCSPGSVSPGQQEAPRRRERYCPVFRGKGLLLSSQIGISCPVAG